MSIATSIKKVDKSGYNDFYKDKSSVLLSVHNSDDYVRIFEITGLSPYYLGGNTKAYVTGLAVRTLMTAADSKGLIRDQITVLDAGCGLGELSVYFACSGFKVIGVDISEQGCRAAEQLAMQVGVSQICTFLAESLEHLSVPDSSIDFIIGRGALHHFIKYEGVPGEFYRVLKEGSQAFFADGFGENRIYHIFHDKKKMERLGDVTLTRKLITNYFSEFKVELKPTDWFVMLDKLYLRYFPKRFEPIIRSLSRLHFWLDRRIPSTNRISLFFSGSVMTSITKKS